MPQHGRVRVRGSHWRKVAAADGVWREEQARRGRAHKRGGAAPLRWQRGLVHAKDVPLNEKLLALQLQLRVHRRVVDVRTQRNFDSDDDVLGDDEEDKAW
jgi:hypothetical protein